MIVTSHTALIVSGILSAYMALASAAQFVEHVTNPTVVETRR